MSMESYFELEQVIKNLSLLDEKKQQLLELLEKVNGDAYQNGFDAATYSDWVDSNFE